MKSTAFRLLPLLAAGALALTLAACEGVDSQPPDTRSPTDIRKQGTTGKIFGDDAFIFGGPDKPKPGEGGGGIGVNSFLWRASLDTLLFMPVTSADPFGGVIITDWHTPPEAPANERFKLNVYILGRDLRADGVRVAVFRQVNEGGTWRDAPVANNVGVKVEDAILMKARQLRHETMRK